MSSLRRAAMLDSAPSASSIMLLSLCGAIAAGEYHVMVTIAFMAVLAWVGLLNVHRVALLANALDDAVANAKLRAAQEVATPMPVMPNGPAEDVEAFVAESGALVLRWYDVWMLREPALRFHPQGTPVNFRRENGQEVHLRIVGLDPDGYPLLTPAPEGSNTYSPEV